MTTVDEKQNYELNSRNQESTNTKKERSEEADAGATRHQPREREGALVEGRSHECEIAGAGGRGVGEERVRKSRVGRRANKKVNGRGTTQNCQKNK
jgi:hypothetical protein